MQSVEWHKKALCSLNSVDVQNLLSVAACSMHARFGVEASLDCQFDRIGSPQGPTDDDAITSIGRRLAERRREEAIAKEGKGHGKRAIAQLRIASVAGVFECTGP